MIYVLSYMKQTESIILQKRLLEAERTDFENKIMQGDVLRPLVSSDMVDKKRSKAAIETE